MDTASFVAGVVGTTAVSLGGFVIGTVKERRRRPRPEPRPEPEICLCTHGANVHDAKGCHAEGRKRVTAIDRHNATETYVFDECTCIRYVGPNSTYIPELSDS
jgi:hypothetical protein